MSGFLARWPWWYRDSEGIAISKLDSASLNVSSLWSHVDRAESYGLGRVLVGVVMTRAQAVENL